MRVPALSGPTVEPAGAPSWFRPAVARLLDPVIVLWLLLATSSVIPLLFSDPSSTTLNAQARATLRVLNLPGLVLAFVLLVLYLPRWPPFWRVIRPCRSCCSGSGARWRGRSIQR